MNEHKKIAAKKVWLETQKHTQKQFIGKTRVHSRNKLCLE